MLFFFYNQFFFSFSFSCTCLMGTFKKTDCNPICMVFIEVFLVPRISHSIHCKEELAVHVQQKSQWLYPCFYPCPISFWTSLQLENMSTTEINTDWKLLQICNPNIFMGLNSSLNWLKSRTTKIKEI